MWTMTDGQICPKLQVISALLHQIQGSQCQPTAVEGKGKMLSNEMHIHLWHKVTIEEYLNT